MRIERQMNVPTQPKPESGTAPCSSAITFPAANPVGLPPPPAGLCGMFLMFAGSQHYCGRKLFEGHDRCFWHLESTEKYSPAAVESYFGPGATLRTAIEAEVVAGHSLERAYLKKVVLRGSPLGPGCKLRNGSLSGQI